jgi:hypothetical protein
MRNVEWLKNTIGKVGRWFGARLGSTRFGRHAGEFASISLLFVTRMSHRIQERSLGKVFLVSINKLNESSIWAAASSNQEEEYYDDSSLRKRTIRHFIRF